MYIALRRTIINALKNNAGTPSAALDYQFEDDSFWQTEDGFYLELEGV
jgi:hypothetical protein